MCTHSDRLMISSVYTLIDFDVVWPCSKSKKKIDRPPMPLELFYVKRASSFDVEKGK